MKLLISIDKQGNEKIIGEYEIFSTNDNRFFLLLDSNNKWGLINYKGEIILPCEFDSVNTSFKDDMILVKKDDSWGFYNIDGTKVVDCIFSSAIAFDQGIAAVKEKDIDLKYYLINLEGERVSKNSFEYVYGFYEKNLAYFINNEKYGFINKKGEIIIDAKYERAEVFSEGIASVKFNNK